MAAIDRSTEPSNDTAGPALNGHSIEEIADILAGAGLGVGAIAPNHARLIRLTYQELAVGRALVPEQLERMARATGVSLDLARAAASRWLEFDASGALTGFGGLTLLPTGHRLVVNDAVLYLWCALDAFLVVHALRCPIRVETRCPSTGTSIQVNARSERIETVTPYAAVMSIVAAAPSRACSAAETRRDFCAFVNFYACDRAARDAIGPDGAILTMDDALELARLIIAPVVKGDPEMSTV